MRHHSLLLTTESRQLDWYKSFGKFIHRLDEKLLIMITIRSNEYLKGMLRELLMLPNETEWIEFKHNNSDPETIGEYISALSNSAALIGKLSAFMVWGVEDKTHNIIGTSFKPFSQKKDQEDLENWLLRHLTPRINFSFYEIEIDDKNIVILEIDSAKRQPVQFHGIEFIRIGSYKKKLKDFQEKERDLWRVFDKIPFEIEVAAEGVSVSDVLRLIDTDGCLKLLRLPVRASREGLFDSLEKENIVKRHVGDTWNITNLGALLFASNLDEFPHLKRKSVRVIQYADNSRISTLREQDEKTGYACGFASLCAYISNVLPTNEVIEQALRRQVPMFPELAVRELIANAMIHQDFHLTGVSPMVEIFSNRIEITNPGAPLILTERFLDNPPRSRNEALASMMRRIGYCEERGIGIDKVVFQTEFYQLPAPLFETWDDFTRSVLFAHKDLKDMERSDRIRACYLHACLKFVNRDSMTNSSLRQRFKISDNNSAIITRMIRDAVEDKVIRPKDATAGRKYMQYVPFWA